MVKWATGKYSRDQHPYTQALLDAAHIRSSESRTQTVVRWRSVLVSISSWYCNRCAAAIMASTSFLVAPWKKRPPGAMRTLTQFTSTKTHQSLNRHRKDRADTPSVKVAANWQAPRLAEGLLG